MRTVARKGDPTSTGGMIQEGDSSWLSEGYPTTYIGMIATCPACKVGQGPIVAVGPRSIIGPGGPVARRHRVHLPGHHHAAPGPERHGPAIRPAIRTAN